MNNNDEVINKFIDFANETISCGPSCQRERKIQKLKEKYETIKSNYNNGEERIAEAKKEYLIYAKGDVYYYQMLREQNKNKAMKNMDKKQINYEKKINELRRIERNNNILNTNLQQLQGYYDNLEKENNNITDKINEFEKIVYTSDRKAYYENEELKDIKSKNLVYKIIYFLILTILAIYIVLIKKDYKKITLIKLFIYLILPFIGLFVINKVLLLFNYILSYFPENVYKKILVFNEDEKLDEKGLLRMSLL
jgi:chromosome segregation ATPase